MFVQDRSHLLHKSIGAVATSGMATSLADARRPLHAGSSGHAQCNQCLCVRRFGKLWHGKSTWPRRFVPFPGVLSVSPVAIVTAAGASRDRWCGRSRGACLGLRGARVRAREGVRKCNRQFLGGERCGRRFCLTAYAFAPIVLERELPELHSGRYGLRKMPYLFTKSDDRMASCEGSAHCGTR